MILPDLILPKLSNQNFAHSGIDSENHCRDPQHFRSYPWSIAYNYNSRGFRDTEWPDTVEQLKKSIWCVGDSFTVGIGSPGDHAWPTVLQKTMGVRTINVSMDGASNNWIARQARAILSEINPDFLILHWSYLHRREGLQFLDGNEKHNFFIHYENIRGPDWPDISQVDQFSELPAHIQNELLSGHDASWRKNITDEQLRLWHIKSDIQQDIANTQQCIDLVEQAAHGCRLVHSFIPDSVKAYQSEFQPVLKTKFPMIEELTCLDLARDGHHYDFKTSEYFVQQIQQVLNL
jgi:hypothetical protein